MSEFDESLWGTEEVAAFLDIPVSTLHYWRARSEGPPGFKIGRHLRYAPSEVREWVLSQRLSQSAGSWEP